jgi:uncharacterized protein
VSAGADVDRQDRTQQSAFLIATSDGYVDLLRLTIQAGADVHPALLEAIILGDGGPRHTEVVRLLVDAGAGVKIADSGGVTPLAHARARGFTAIAGILEAKGARSSDYRRRRGSWQSDWMSPL